MKAVALVTPSGYPWQAYPTPAATHIGQRFRLRNTFSATATPRGGRSGRPNVSATAITFPAVAGLVVAGFRSLFGAVIGSQTAI